MDDELATAAHITALTIQRAINSLPGPVDEIYASGGGIWNKAIMGWMKTLLPPTIEIRTLTDFGIQPDAKEALAFALLGAATLDGFPSNVPSVTGARRSVVLGSITPKP